MSDGETSTETTGRAVSVREPALYRWGSWLGCPLAGLALGLLLQLLGRWLLSLSWVPMPGWAKVVLGAPQPWSSLVAGGLGLVAGLVFAWLWERDRLVVTVEPGQAELRRGPRRRTVQRSTVDGVLHQGRQLIVQDGAGAELAREDSSLRAGELRAAFTGAGWPWLTEDPHAERFRLWLPEDPTLPAGADVILIEREKQLGRSILGEEDARRLLGELAKLGVYVRDEGKRQYWRGKPD